MAFSYSIPCVSTHMVRAAPYVPPEIFGLMLALAAVAYGAQLPVAYKLMKTRSKRCVIYFGIIICIIALGLCTSDPGEAFTSVEKGVFFNIMMILFGFMIYPYSEHSYVLKVAKKLFIARTHEEKLFKLDE